MPETPLSKLQSVDPRSVWPHEAHDFTPWLLEHADHLADVLGIELELTAAEHPVGGFSLDLIGQDVTNDCTLIVENQLTTTDHLHLGQLLTYAAGTDAATVVWMATEFRDEHRQALDFLNEIAGDDARFFGIEVTVVRIDESSPAPLFRLAAKPNDWRSQLVSATRAARRSGGRSPLYFAFWQRLFEEAAARSTPWYRPRKPQPSNWVDLHRLGSGVHYSISFAQGGRLQVQLYIDTGDGERNLSVLHGLQQHSAEIEAKFGEPLDWLELPNRRACRVASLWPGDITDEAEHDRYVDEIIDRLTRLDAAIDPAWIDALLAEDADGE